MRRRYPTDLTDAQWGCIEPYITFANRRGRPRIHSLRRVLDAVFYVLRSGCAWRLLPRDFPPWRVVYYYWGSGNGVLRVLSSILTRSCAGACENSRGETPNPAPGDSGLPDRKDNRCRWRAARLRRRRQEGARHSKRHLLVDTEKA